MPKHRNTPRIALFVAAFLVIGATIVFLKRGTTQPNSDAADSTKIDAAKGPMAVPDTSISKEILPSLTDTMQRVVPDTLERDTRPAAEAGAEDGYWDGYYDGVAGREKNNMNVDCRYASPDQCDIYAQEYAESYHRGYTEGESTRTKE